MRILHLIYDDVANPWIGGGGARRTFEIYRRFPRHCEVTVVAGPHPRAPRRESVGEVVFERRGFGRSMIASAISYLTCAVSHVRNKDYDIVVEDFSPFTPCLAPLHTEKPAVALVQNIFNGELLRMYGLAGWLPLIAERQGLRLFGNLIAVSEGVKNAIARLTPYGGKVEVIPNGVSEYPFTLSGYEENFILFLGRLNVYQKGIDLLLQAFGQLARECKDIRLVLVGGGSQEGPVRRMVAACSASSRIEMLGRVSEKRKFDLISRSTVVCVPSRFESWGMVALEAAACGKPVVATRVSGLEEVVVDGLTGLLVSPTPETIAEGLSRLLDDRSLRNRLGLEAKKRATTFNWDTIAQRQYTFYCSCIKK